LKAAQKLGLKEVPVALADELTDAQVKAFRILANKSANWAEWDTDLLKLELEELQELDINLELTGFDAEELGDIWLDGDGGQDEPKGEDYHESLSVVVDCDDEAQQEALFDEFTKRGLKCRVQSL
jgi:hypothetical protein